jgi:hypothetical protein
MGGGGANPKKNIEHVSNGRKKNVIFRDKQFLDLQNFLNLFTSIIHFFLIENVSRNKKRGEPAFFSSKMC